MTGPNAAVVALLAAVLLSGCAGSPCDELTALRAERDRARAAYLDLARSGSVTPAEGEAADAAVHELDRRVYDLEQGCADR